MFLRYLKCFCAINTLHLFCFCTFLYFSASNTLPLLWFLRHQYSSSLKFFAPSFLFLSCVYCAITKKMDTAFKCHYCMWPVVGNSSLLLSLLIATFTTFFVHVTSAILSIDNIESTGMQMRRYPCNCTNRYFSLELLGN